MRETEAIHCGVQQSKPSFDDLEARVNEWMAQHPDIVAENTHTIAQPNVGWDTWHSPFGTRRSRSLLVGVAAHRCR